MNFFERLFRRRSMRAELAIALSRPDDPRNIGIFAEAAWIGDATTHAAASEALTLLLARVAPHEIRSIRHGDHAPLCRFLDAGVRYPELTLAVIGAIERAADTSALHPLERLITRLRGAQTPSRRKVLDAAYHCARVLREHHGASEETLLRSSFAPSIPEDSERDHEL